METATEGYLDLVQYYYWNLANVHAQILEESQSNIRRGEPGILHGIHNRVQKSSSCRC